jgi:hypothetical protein
VAFSPPSRTDLAEATQHVALSFFDAHKAVVIGFAVAHFFFASRSMTR